MGKIVSRKKFPAYEYVCAALIFIGVSVFLLWNPQETEKNYTKETTVSFSEEVQINWVDYWKLVEKSFDAKIASWCVEIVGLLFGGINV